MRIARLVFWMGVEAIGQTLAVYARERVALAMGPLITRAVPRPAVRPGAN